MYLDVHENKLLNKFNLSLNSLDYQYIERSRNIGEIENILRVLRSGEEGVYPDLQKFCENHLRELSPKSKLLQVQKPIVHSKDLPTNEQQNLYKDFKMWEEQMKQHGMQINTATNYPKGHTINTPVRQISEISCNFGNKDKKATTHSVNKFKSSGKTMSFSDWNKFNVEAELKKIDEEDSKANKKTKDVKNKDCSIFQPYINTRNMTDKERISFAEREKIKGNEAFKVGDYEEAEKYYSHSIVTHTTVAALNNRGFTCYKLKKFTAALLDYNTVLCREPENVKALYRRGLLYKDTGRPQLAYMDFANVLDLDPSNKLAKEQLASIDVKPVDKNDKSIFIEEILDEEDTRLPSDESGNRDVFSNNIETKISKEKTRHDEDKKISHRLPSKTLAFLDISGNTKSVSDSDIGLSKICERPITKKDLPGTKKQVVVEIEPLPVTCDSLRKKCNETSAIDEYDQHLDDNEKTNAAQIYLVESEMASNNSTKNITPFKFQTMWRNQNANDNYDIGVNILEKIHPQQLATMVANNLNTDMLCGIIGAIKNIVATDPTMAHELLLSLSKAARIKTLVSLLSTEEQNEIKDILEALKDSNICICEEMEHSFF